MQVKKKSGDIKKDILISLRKNRSACSVEKQQDVLSLGGQHNGSVVIRLEERHWILTLNKKMF